MIIGIDLGTSTTEAAVFRNGEAEMIPNREGEIVTPSVIGLDENGEFVIGEKAKAQYILHPERTAIEIKRKLGTAEKVKLGNKYFTPVELLAKLLEYVRSFSSEYLGEDVNRAVISVPAYFDDIQRQEVVKAGQMAGFTVERIINEPTAAALSYGISHMEEESNILVYDLGGGTFDVTLLEMFGGVLEVKASSGDNKLGGKDFDECLIRWLTEKFENDNKVSLKGDIYASVRLKEQAEACKKILSVQEETAIRLPMLARKNDLPLALEETVTRQKFEELIQGHIKRTHDPVDTVLMDGGVQREELDRILLVGGSTRIPLVARDIEEKLGKTVDRAVHPDYSVAEGAAIQAAIIDGVMEEEETLVMTDVNPYSLGVRTFNGVTDDNMSVVIPRNVTIPVTRRETYSTSADGQTQADIMVYQGESKTASKNHFLGKFVLAGIPYNRAGKESIEVSFSYDMNGILDVTATVVSTGQKASIVIDMMEAKEEETVDVSKWKEAQCASDFRAVIRRAERFLKKHQDEEELCQEIEEVLYDLKAAIIEEDVDEADELSIELEDLMEEGK